MNEPRQPNAKTTPGYTARGREDAEQEDENDGDGEEDEEDESITMAPSARECRCSPSPTLPLPLPLQIQPTRTIFLRPTTAVPRTVLHRAVGHRHGRRPDSLLPTGTQNHWNQARARTMRPMPIIQPTAIHRPPPPSQPEPGPRS